MRFTGKQHGDLIIPLPVSIYKNQLIISTFVIVLFFVDKQSRKHYQFSESHQRDRDIYREERTVKVKVKVKVEDKVILDRQVVKR